MRTRNLAYAAIVAAVMSGSLIMVSRAVAQQQPAQQQDAQTEFVGTLAKLYYRAIGDNQSLNARVQALQAELASKTTQAPAPAAPEAPK